MRGLNTGEIQPLYTYVGYELHRFDALDRLANVICTMSVQGDHLSPIANYLYKLTLNIPRFSRHKRLTETEKEDAQIQATQEDPSL